jgi:hypothetical protein
MSSKGNIRARKQLNRIARIYTRRCEAYRTGNQVFSGRAHKRDVKLKIKSELNHSLERSTVTF